MELSLVLAVVLIALVFEYINGFHDTANSIATTVSTKALSPRVAVAIAAVLNFAGAFVSLKVAATIAKGIVDQEIIVGRAGLNIVLAGLVGAITWNLVTWFFGLPSSSSHALVGGVVGAALAAHGSKVIKWGGIKEKVLVPSLVAPFIGVGLAFVIESSFVSITGLLIGALTGIVLGDSLVGAFFPQIDRSIVAIPWSQIALIVLATYLFSLLTTILPAWQAARIYPAEALRYE